MLFYALSLISLNHVSRFHTASISKSLEYDRAIRIPGISNEAPQLMPVILLPTLLLLCLAIRDTAWAWALLAAALTWLLTGVGLLRSWPHHYALNKLDGVSWRLTLAAALSLLLTMILAVLHTDARFNSLAEFASAGLLPVLSIGAPMLACLASPSTRQKIMNGVLAVIFMCAIASIIETGVSHHRPSGPFLDANVLGSFFNTGLIALTSMLTAKRGGRLHWCGISVIAAAQALTASRGADIALMAALTIFAFCIWRCRGSFRSLIGAIFLVFAAHLSTLALPFELRASGTADLLMHPTSGASASARIAMWKSTLEAYQHESPFLGTGLGTYVLIYPRYRTNADPQSSGQRAHNDYLERLLEGGPLLALSTLGLGLILPFLLLARTMRLIQSGQNEDPPNTISRFGSLAVCIGIGLHAIVNFILTVPSLDFLFALHLANALPPTQAPSSERLRTTQQPLPFWIKAIGLSSVILMPSIILTIALGAWLMGSSGNHFRQRDPENWLQLANLGASLQPSNPRFHEAIVGSELSALREGLIPPGQRTVVLRSTRWEIDGWLATNRCDTHAWESLAQLAQLEISVAGITSLNAYRTALHCQPQSLGLRAAVAFELERSQQNAAAYAVLRRGFEWASISRADYSMELWLEAGTRLSKDYGNANDQSLWHEWAAQYMEAKSRPVAGEVPF